MHQEAKITSTQKDTSIYMETVVGENHKSFCSSSSIDLHRFVGTSLLEAPAPKICKKVLAIGYNKFEVPTLKGARNRNRLQPN